MPGSPTHINVAALLILLLAVTLAGAAPAQAQRTRDDSYDRAFKICRGTDVLFARAGDRCGTVVNNQHELTATRRGRSVSADSPSESALVVRIALATCVSMRG